jgi:hypothetical protein
MGAVRSNGRIHTPHTQQGASTRFGVIRFVISDGVSRCSSGAVSRFCRDWTDLSPPRVQ